MLSICTVAFSINRSIQVTVRLSSIDGLALPNYTCTLHVSQSPIVTLYSWCAITDLHLVQLLFHSVFVLRPSVARPADSAPAKRRSPRATALIRRSVTVEVGKLANQFACNYLRRALADYTHVCSFGRARALHAECNDVDNSCIVRTRDVRRTYTTHVGCTQY